LGFLGSEIDLVLNIEYRNWGFSGLAKSLCRTPSNDWRLHHTVFIPRFFNDQLHWSHDWLCMNFKLYGKLHSTELLDRQDA
jgi:hypothetical protein